MKRTIKNAGKTIAIVLFTLWGFSQAQAQNAALTKEETINYINKKIEETTNHYFSVKGGDGVVRKLYYAFSSFELRGNKIVYKRSRRTYPEKQYGKREWVENRYAQIYPCDYFTLEHEMSFAPENIISVEEEPPLIPENKNDPVGSIKVTLVKNTALFEIVAGNPTEGDGFRCATFKMGTPETHTVSEIYISYLKGDGSNFNKLKKALEYLRDLAKAEDDPFGN
jgi:hypothetical protein